MKKHALADLQQFVKEYPFPTDVLVEVTARCNLNCIMCPRDRLTREQKDMPWELWCRIVDEVARKSPETRIWPALMGEPLLLGDEIFRMIRYAKDAGVGGVHLNSNMAAFVPDMLDGLLDSGLDELLVGIDAASAPTYEHIRGGGNYNRLVENILNVVDAKENRGCDRPRVTLQFIGMDENEHEQQAFIDFWKQSGKKVSLKIKPRTGWADGVAPGSAPVEAQSIERSMPCTWLLRQMTIFCNGEVPQCDGDWNGKTSFGNVRDDSIENIWLQNLKEIRDRHFRHEFDYFPCNVCEDWKAGRAEWVECG
ncbi:radical SAM/SPASM domain-containing protein [Thermodesulfobacteriota bacterium]